MPDFNPRSAANAPPAAAFTLVELLVAVSIIALLMAILMPAMSRAREASRRAVCASNLHQQVAAFQDYAADSFTMIPMGYLWTSKQYNFSIYDLTVGLNMPLGTIYTSGRLQSRGNWICPSLIPYHTLALWPPGGYKGQKNDDNSRSCFGLRTTLATGSDSGDGNWGKNGTGGKPLVTPYFVSLNRVKASQALLSDQCQIPLIVQYGHRDGVNAAYFDGSTRYISLNLFKKYLDKIPDGLDSPTNNGPFRQIWDVFDTH